MARRKNSTRLFEVMQSARSSMSSSPSRSATMAAARASLAAPSPQTGWFAKRRHGHDGAVPHDPAQFGLLSDYAGARVESPIAESANAAAAKMTMAPSALREASAEVAPPPRIAMKAAEVRAAAATVSAAGPVAAPSARDLGLRFDSDHHLISFKVTYASAIVTTFAVIVIVALSYLVGRAVRSPATTAATAANAQAQTKRIPAPTGVLNVGATPVTANNNAGAGNRPGAPADAGAKSAGNNAPRTGAPAGSGAPANSFDDAKRVVHRNYVVVQIYPDVKTANDMRDLLQKSGVACTVEDGLLGYATREWKCVVGTTGFDRIRGNTDFDAYVNKITQISNTLGSASKFKKFDPKPYSWREN